MNAGITGNAGMLTNLDRLLSWRTRKPAPLVTLAVLTLFGCLAILVVLQVEIKRGIARRTACIGRLTEIAVALFTYHERYGRFPPAYMTDRQGKPAHSWRVLLLEFLKPDLYKQYDFDEPWDGPNNRKLADKIPNCYACDGRHSERQNFFTSFVVISGKGAAFDGAEPVSLRDIRDDLATTILVVESRTSQIPWMAPQDLDIETMSLRINHPQSPSISTDFSGGPLALFADGSKRILDPLMKPGVLRALVTIRGEELIDSESLLLVK